VKIIIGKHEATIYPEGNGYTGAISLGFDATGRRRRVKRKGQTKTEVKDKLREARRRPGRGRVRRRELHGAAGRGGLP
jgi:hypothetical protein